MKHPQTAGEPIVAASAGIGMMCDIAKARARGPPS
jgi:hypothetical protein